MPWSDNDMPPLRTGLAQSVLWEIAEGLAALMSTGQAAAIDLRSLPMTPADRSELEATLGRGDVAAQVNVEGTTELWETRYSGVWWVRHFGADDKIAAESIEIAAVPQILVTHEDDIAAACERVRADLTGEDSGARGESAAHV